MLTQQGAADEDFQDLKKFGVSDEEIERLITPSRPEQRPAEYPLWPEHFHAVLLFISMATQWRTQIGDRMSYLGLDYAALPAAEDRLSVPPELRNSDRASLFDQLRVLERSAMAVLNEAR